MRKSLLLAASLLAAGLLATPVLSQQQTSAADIEKKFDTYISSSEMDGWMKKMAAEPNHVGSPHDKANAEDTLARFKAWGWDAKIEEFRVLYPTPLKVQLDLVTPRRFSATLTEKPVPGDATSSRTKAQLPAYVAFQGDGDVTAPLVYVNYGMPDDYKALERMGVDVKGKIVIARYGQGWRGLKPKLAQDHGAVGCIIYSDPQNDGYSVDDAYPKGGAPRPRLPARFRRRHAALSGRPADAGRRRHGRRRPHQARRRADHPQNPGAADLLRRRRKIPRRARWPRRAIQLARPSHHLPCRRHGRGQGPLVVKSEWSLNI
jgi:hypothetical protein